MWFIPKLYGYFCSNLGICPVVTHKPNIFVIIFQEFENIYTCIQLYVCIQIYIYIYIYAYIYIYFSDAFVFVVILIKDMVFPLCIFIVIHECL